MQKETSETIAMKLLNNVTGTITKNADKIGALIGWFNEPSTSTIDASIGAIKDWFTGPYHLDQIKQPLQFVIEQKIVPNVVVPYVLMELAKEFNIPMVGKWIPAIQKLLMGYAAGYIGAVVVQYGAGDTGHAPTGQPQIWGKGAQSFMAQAPNYSY